MLKFDCNKVGRFQSRLRGEVSSFDRYYAVMSRNVVNLIYCPFFPPALFVFSLTLSSFRPYFPYRYQKFSIFTHGHFLFSPHVVEITIYATDFN